MKKVFFILFFLSTSCGLLFSQTLAFGFFKNHSSKPNLNYLQLSLPLSLYTEFKKDKKYTVLSPVETKKRLKKHKIEMKLSYSDEELAQIYKLLDIRVFIFGGFISDDEAIIVKAKMFLPKRKQILTIHIKGSTGLGIFNIVDQIKNYLNIFLDDKTKYIKEVIKAPAKLAIISNLNSIEMNNLAMEFMSKNYSISAMSFDDFNYWDSKETESFYSLLSEKTSLDTVFIPPKNYNRFILSNIKNNTKLINDKLAYRDLIKSNTALYPIKKSKILTQLKEKFKADYLLILHIDGKKTFARAIKFSSKNLIWIQDRFTLPFFASYSNKNIVKQIIAEMNQIKKIELDFQEVDIENSEDLENQSEDIDQERYNLIDEDSYEDEEEE